MSQGAGSDQAHCSTPAVPPECPDPCLEEGTTPKTVWMRQQAGQAVDRVMLWPKGTPATTLRSPGAEAPREAKSIEGVTLGLSQCANRHVLRCSSKSGGGAPGTDRMPDFPLGGVFRAHLVCPLPQPRMWTFPQDPWCPSRERNLEP